MKNIAVLAVAASAIFGSAFAQKPSVVTDNEPGWRKIGETTASFKSQNESIHVIGADEFAAIKLKVTDAPLEITRLQVFYESGDMEEINVKNKLQAGSETRTFNLKHADRDISKVAFTYNTAPNAQGDKATVELLGLKKGNEDSEAYRKSEEAKDDAQEAAYEAEDDLDRAAEKTERKAEEAADDLDRETDQAERDIDRKADNTENDLERAADKTGDAISKAAADVEATITDKVYQGKVGPKGQKIYIDEKLNKYYYINYEGKKIFITKIQMKDKVDR